MTDESTSDHLPDTTPVEGGASTLDISTFAEPERRSETYIPLRAPTPYPGAITDQKQVTAGNVGVPTQVANPRRASWRTVVQSIIGVLIIAVPLTNVVLGNVSDYLQKQADVAVPGWVWLVLNGGLAVTALVSGLIARIMNTPGAADFIAKYLPFLAPIKQHDGEHEA